MNTELDLARLEALPQALGVSLPEIVATLVEEIDEALTTALAAIGEGDLEATALAAHAARNSALMLGPGPVLDALSRLEGQAGTGDGAGARLANAQVRSLWPQLRGELERAAGACKNRT